VSRAATAYGSVALAAILVDQLIKYLVETGMELHEQIDVLPFLALFRTHNTGISFSMFSGGGWGLVALVIAVTGFIGWLAWKSEPRQVIARVGFALIIAGALGNLIDRLLYGHVVDYVLFHTPAWSFAVFNFADACITVGAVLVILQEVVDWRRTRTAEPPREP
jgi:signal peptidase II